MDGGRPVAAGRRLRMAAIQMTARLRNLPFPSSPSRAIFDGAGEARIRAYKYFRSKNPDHKHNKQKRELQKKCTLLPVVAKLLATEYAQVTEEENAN